MSASLNDLPDASGSGWPWAASPPSPSDDCEYPKISVVTPSYNQAEFLEATLRSVILQNYPNLEYVVIDGGSSDGSVDVIKKYEPWIDHWVSEPDRGQSHAINKGFAHCSGQLATFINSDDMLEPGALVEHAETYGYEPGTIYVGNCRIVNAEGSTLRRHTAQVRSLDDLIDIPNVWRSQPIQGHIVQMEVLFPLDLYRRIGGLERSLDFVMDYVLWGEMLLHGGKIRYTDIDIGIFRQHEAQKTSDRWGVTRSLLSEAIRFARKHPSWAYDKKEAVIDRLEEYRREEWRSTGRLARLGLPHFLVNSIRRVREGLFD